MKTLSCQCLVLFALITGCKDITPKEKPTTNNRKVAKELEEIRQVPPIDEVPFDEIRVIKAKLPAHLQSIDISPANQIPLSGTRQRGIQAAMINFWFIERGHDSTVLEFDYPEEPEFTVSINDCLVAAIELSYSPDWTLYWIILKPVIGALVSKVLFFQESTGAFHPYSHTLGIHAMYHLEQNNLRPSNLMGYFEITSPEIEKIDFDRDTFPDIKFTRLYHNGTANAMEEIVIELQDNTIDTLLFERKWFPM